MVLSATWRLNKKKKAYLTKAIKAVNIIFWEGIVEVMVSAPATHMGHIY